MNRKQISDLDTIWQNTLLVSKFKNLVKKQLPNISENEINNYIAAHPEIIFRKDFKFKDDKSPFIYYIATQPHKLLSIDVIYLPNFSSSSSNGKNFGFCIIDYFSKYLFGTYTKSINALNAKKCLIKYIQKFQNYENKNNLIYLIHDSGTEFLNKIFIDFCNSNNIKQITVNPFLPNKSQMIERSFRTLRSIIANLKASSPNLKYPELFYISIDKYNNNIHSSIGISPRNAIKSQNLEKLQMLHNLNKFKKIAKKKFSTKISNRLKIGDLVYIKKPKHMRGKFSKTGSETLYKKQHFIISDIISTDAGILYKLRNPDTQKISLKNFSKQMLVKIHST